MIVEERIYTLHPGKVPVYMKNYQAEGLAIQEPILGNLVGWYYTDFGPQNQIIHMWGYDSLDERQRRRAECAADPDFLAYVKKAREFIVAQDVRILVPEAGTPDLSKL